MSTELLNKETIKVEITRCLYESGWKPYSCKSLEHKVSFKREYERFHTLAELKAYYGITKLIKKEEKGWAFSPTGKKHEWIEYIAEIPISFQVIK